MLISMLGNECPCGITPAAIQHRYTLCIICKAPREAGIAQFA